MTYTSIGTKFATLAEAVKEARAGKYPANTDDRTAIIVATKLNTRTTTVGVQFWAKEMIAAGKSVNTDGTESTLIESL